MLHSDTSVFTIRLKGIFICAILVVCILSFIGRLLIIEQLYTWGAPWSFSFPTTLAFLSLAAAIFLRRNQQMFLAGTTLLIAISALISKHPEYSAATAVIHISLALSLLFRKKILKYSLIGIALWIVLLALIQAIMDETAPFLDPFFSKMSLPTVVVGLLFTFILIDEKQQTNLSFKSLTIKEFGIAIILLLVWCILAFSINNGSADIGYIIVTSFLTIAAILLVHFQIHSRQLGKRKKDLIRSISDSVIAVITDKEGVILMINDHFCEVSGYSREELIGKTHKLVNSEVHPDEFWKEMWETILSGKVWQANVCNQNKEGRLFWEQTTITPLLDADEEIENFLAVRFDITETILQNESLRLFQRDQESLIENLRTLTDFRGRMLQIAAHDLRTPLGQMISMGDLLLDPKTSNEIKDSLVKELHERAQASLKEVDLLLTLEKDRHHLTEPDLEELNPSQEIRYELSAHQYGIENKKLRVSSRIKFDKTISAPKRLFVHIVRNLVSNAVKYTPYAGHIEIVLSEADDMLVFSVSDSGEGIPECDRERIFEPFYAKSKKSNSKDKSWGLGLAFVYEAIYSNNGTIEVSKSRFGGACFTVRIPHSQDQLSHPIPPTPLKMTSIEPEHFHSRVGT